MGTARAMSTPYPHFECNYHLIEIGFRTCHQRVDSRVVQLSTNDTCLLVVLQDGCGSQACLYSSDPAFIFTLEAYESDSTELTYILLSMT